MTCYLISQSGEPVALVADIGIARAIAHCQPWGEYLVEELEVEDPAWLRASRTRRSSIQQKGGGGRRLPKRRPDHWSHGIPSSAIERARRQAR
jgi:hypothetical protein